MMKKKLCVELGASSTDSCILYLTYHNTISMLICCLSVEHSTVFSCSPNKYGINTIRENNGGEAGKVKVYDVI